MPGELTPADRKLLWGAGLIGLVLVAGTVAFAPAEGTRGLEVPSSYSSGSGGARAAYLLLLDLGYRVQRWENPPAGLASEAPRAMLIIAEPSVMPTAHERRAIVEFVRGGGRLLFCGAALSAFFQEADLRPEISGMEQEEFSARLPGYITRNAPRVVIRPEAYWGKLGESQLAIYGNGQAISVVAWRMGAGDVLWWAGATPLTNGGITRAGNLSLFLNAVSTPPSAAPRAIYWDEYFHGERGSLWTYFDKTPLAWCLVQIALVFAGLLFTFARRSGPITAPAAVSRLSPLEFVDTMGGLYQRAGAQSIAVAVSYRHLRLELTRRLGLATGVGDGALAQAAGERLGFDSHLAGTLEDAALADSGRLRPVQALVLVQKLASYASQLNARPSPQEKN
jgi:hypothetical protein